MNALVGQKVKVNCSLSLLASEERANDDGCKNRGYFVSTGTGAHLRGRCEFEIFHDGLRGIATVRDGEAERPKRMAKEGNWCRKFALPNSPSSDGSSFLNRAVVIVNRGVQRGHIQLPCLRTLNASQVVTPW